MSDVGGGLGIGLAIVRSLVGLHGGTVRAESAGAGEGSRFVISLPRLLHVEAEPSSIAIAAVGEPGQDRLKVLVVNDNENATEMLALLVESLVHSTAVEHHPRRALERVGRERPDVCLLDIGMPDMNGYELVKAIRTQLV